MPRKPKPPPGLVFLANEAVITSPSRRKTVTDITTPEGTGLSWTDNLSGYYGAPFNALAAKRYLAVTTTSDMSRIEEHLRHLEDADECGKKRGRPPTERRSASAAVDM
ncbi:hypothetical protein PFICI_08891 [Pestalotiopsis fici W106-1]|uniref:Uncharacterized protein n=1 Tax=Pestalotiopsis fici (strain W106-1 / CGMCC3.15140) TaxID=1229662 RepID=W3WYT6_PESFW|nr:uncharacterized protein PFICI_08891 [Pestalotiopsis fici W106-1]ETS79038.1 hypothetical protein PFICI_08891 [Pestalotiopsis fici W106-1]